MKAAFFIFVTLVLTAPGGRAQGIGGRVQTGQAVPVPFISVALLEDSVLVAGVVTDSAGDFRFNNPLRNGHSYLLRLSGAGFRLMEKTFVYPDTSGLSPFVLLRDEKLLSEVSVSSRKPMITHQADRYIVNVENSYLANGSTGLEVLRRSPGIWVSPSGEIRITGGQTVTVMINNVVQRMSSADLADFLQSLRSEDISRIEVIPNPPSEFEAAATGGIIHIVLRRSRKNGLTGILSTQYRQQNKDPNLGLGGSFDYKSGAIYLFGGYNYSRDRSEYSGWTNVHYPDKTSLYNTTARDNDNTRRQFRAGLVYDPSAAHSITFQLTGTESSLVQQFLSGLDYTLPSETVTGKAYSFWNRSPRQTSYTASYVWKLDTVGSSLTLIGDYTDSRKSESNELSSGYSDAARDQVYRTITPSSTSLSSLQADFVQNWPGRAVLRAGAKHVYTNRNNTVLTERWDQLVWEKDPLASNEYHYTEALWMFYGSFEKTIGVTSIKAGLRGEKTLARGRSITLGQSLSREYFGWFPSLFVSHLLNKEEGNLVTLSYSRKVKRPGYNDLNPYRLQVHDFTVITGNPELRPQYNHSLRAGYTYRQHYTASVYYQSAQDYIAQTASTVDSNIIEYKSKNFSGSREYGLALDAVFSVTKFWESSNSLSGYFFSAELGGTRYFQRSFSVQTSQNIRWKGVLDFDVQLQYRSPYLSANARQAQILSSYIGVMRKIWKQRGRLRFFVTDIFNTEREKEVSEFNGTHIDFYQKRPTRTVGLSLNYTFQVGRWFSKKKIEQGDQEEKNRL